MNTAHSPIPRLGRIVAGGGSRLFTIRRLPNGLYVKNRRPEANWGRAPDGWTIHRTADARDQSLGHGRTLEEAAALAITLAR